MRLVLIAAVVTVAAFLLFNGYKNKLDFTDVAMVLGAVYLASRIDELSDRIDELSGRIDELDGGSPEWPEE